MAIRDMRNEYASLASGALDAPKLVWAGLAFSLAMRLCGDDMDAALKMLGDEWQALHDAGIVPQKVKRARHQRTTRLVGGL